MSPQVEAALIAGIVSLISLGGTVVVAVIGFRTTRNVTGSTLAEQHMRTLNERFATAADKLGSEAPAVRLAGVYAMASLADDWEMNRQTCIDVLCGCLRLPYESALDPNNPAEELAYKANQKVRHAVIQVIGKHLRGDTGVSWQGHDLNFDGAVFDDDSFGDDFLGAHFCGKGTVSFRRACFSSGRLSFRDAVFSGGRVTFRDAVFGGGRVSFGNAQFVGGTVNFTDAKFAGSKVDFIRTEFSGGEVHFGGAKFLRGRVDFRGAKFSSSKVDFTRTRSYLAGVVVRKDAEFSGGEVDFSDAADWSVPPVFPRTDPPPSGVKLPKKEDQSEA